MVRVGSADLLDGDNLDVKVAQGVVLQCPKGTPDDERESCPVRTGRFRFERKQHEVLVARDGRYHLRVQLAPGGRSVHLCDLSARALTKAFGPTSDGVTIPWNRACAIPASEDGG